TWAMTLKSVRALRPALARMKTSAVERNRKMGAIRVANFRRARAPPRIEARAALIEAGPQALIEASTARARRLPGTWPDPRDFFRSGSAGSRLASSDGKALHVPARLRGAAAVA